MTGSESNDNILEMQGITKKFPGVVALDRINLQVRRGEVHVLVGENGAGKSTLIKLLCGVYQPDEGETRYEQQLYSPQNTMDAFKAGIRVVHQELNLLTYLTVAENIFFEKLPRKHGLVQYHHLYEETRALLKEVGLDVSPQMQVGLLGIAQMQLIEIAKALSNESKVLILDEPTATLTPREITRLFEIIKRLKEKGVTIIYISHHLHEIFEIGDRVTVLRNGRKVETRELKEVTIPEIVRLMVGHEMKEEYLFRAEQQPGQEMFRVEDLRYKDKATPISFKLRQGEILGVAGLVGSGRTETMRAIFGADRKRSGKIFLDGREIKIKNTREAVQHGISLLTEDRKSQGLILNLSCYVNTTITNLPKVTHFGLVNNRQEKELSAKLAEELNIRTPSVEQLVRNLSGGNQQKVVLAKWLFRDSRVLIFDEPTRGIDVGARYEIYNLLWQLAARGKGLIVVSSDLPELLGICHRIMVFSKGKLVGEVEREEFNQEKILALAYQEYVKSA
ncbi:MAG TPA: sugar ABC transporter ATP-binding protein [Chloroflexia bacterium]|nr:sugar ABC transporter ATP-binding protein [Chloroflexia bacterium]